MIAIRVRTPAGSAALTWEAGAVTCDGDGDACALVLEELAKPHDAIRVDEDPDTVDGTPITVAGVATPEGFLFALHHLVGRIDAELDWSSYENTEPPDRNGHQ